MLFMIPPVVLVAVAGSDDEDADDTWVDNWIPVDNRADADGAGGTDDGQVNEVVVDVEVVDVNVEVTEGALSDEDGKSWSGAADESMLSVSDWKKKYLYGKNVRRKLMLHNFFICIGIRGYSDSYILSQREKKPSIIFFSTKQKKNV